MQKAMRETASLSLSEKSLPAFFTVILSHKRRILQCTFAGYIILFTGIIFRKKSTLRSFGKPQDDIK